VQPAAGILGITPHSGWAAAVLLAGTPNCRRRAAAATRAHSRSTWAIASTVRWNSALSLDTITLQA